MGPLTGYGANSCPLAFTLHGLFLLEPFLISDLIFSPAFRDEKTGLDSPPAPHRGPATEHAPPPTLLGLPAQQMPQWVLSPRSLRACGKAERTWAQKPSSAAHVLCDFGRVPSHLWAWGHPAVQCTYG